MILSTSGALFQAAGKTDHMFYVGVMNTAVTVTGFLVAALGFGTLTAMAWAWDITLFINFVNSYAVMYRRTFHSRWTEVYRAILPQTINTAFVATATIILYRYVSFQNIFGSLAWIVGTVSPADFHHGRFVEAIQYSADGKKTIVQIPEYHLFGNRTLK